MKVVLLIVFPCEGAICGSAETINALMDLHLGPVMLLGPTLEPKTASDLHLRIPHLGLRMAEHSRRALACAKLLSMVWTVSVFPFFTSL
jgi:methionine-gamma-lyase